jgi:uncharacterized protein DUF4238
MSGPRDNHYVPQFLLSRWCDRRGKLTVYARRQGRVVTSELSPRSTAFEPDLYSYEGVSAENRHAIEANFMTPHIDTPAASIVQKIVDGGLTGLTTDERSHFTRFVLSLRARHPDAVAMARTEGGLQLTASLARDPEEYLAARAPSSPPTFPEWTEKHAPGLIENFGMSVLTGVITDDKTGERVFRMPWWTYDVRDASTDLLISDRPCLLEGNALEGECVIVFPLSPTVVFFISNDERRTRALRATGPTPLVETINRASIGYAARRVYGTGKHHLPLFEKYLRNS